MLRDGAFDHERLEILTIRNGGIDLLERGRQWVIRECGGEIHALLKLGLREGLRFLAPGDAQFV